MIRIETASLADARAHAGIVTARRPQRITANFAGRFKPTEFERLSALGARIQDLRGDRGLELERGQATWPGFDTIPGFNVYALDELGERTFLAFAYIEGRPREVLELAIRKAEAEQ